MIGIVVISHGQMAVECLRTAEMIIGQIPRCYAISIDRTCSVEEATASLSQAIAEVGADEDGVLILTDMFGGTPTNIAADFLTSASVDILTGMNLPMLIKAASARSHQDLVGLAVFLHEYGKQAILRPLDLLKS